MRFVASFTVLLVSSMHCRADQPIQNTLTPAEIAEGWILLFDGKTTFGWNPEGDIKIENGDLILGGLDGARITTSSAFGQQSTLKYDFEPSRADAELAIDVQFGPRFSFLNFDWPRAGTGIPRSGPETWRKRWHTATISATHVNESKVLRGISVQEIVGRGNGDWQSKVFGNSSDPAELAATRPITFRTFPNEKVRLRNIKLKPSGLTPIFNGKSLAGWHEYKGPDAKSKFSVTPEGTLHIENGKGDLQTDKQWSDFLLQIECRTNAPALNSGVFFRCLPNKYQQGYEAQIQNSFLPTASKEYVIDRYDPQTHKLLSKDKVKYDSVDYGTGSIYRRIPARFKAANDKEWCTMTVLAEGRHMGVWVNGIMVTDWTDNRPVNDNGRNGFKAGPGNISLQGHDPTTNLDFRNIRIVDLSKK